MESENQVKVVNSQYLEDRDKLEETEGKAWCQKWNSGACGVKFSFFQPFGDYDIISTDYTSYAIVYSCSPFFANAYCLEYLWILTREPYEIGSAQQILFISEMS